MSSKQKLLAVFVAVVIGGSAPVGAQETASNQDLIDMIAAGLPEAVILAKIDQTPVGERDTSAEALIALKNAGATEAVLTALVGESEGSAPKPEADGNPLLAAAQAQEDYNEIKMITDDGEVTLRAARAQMQSSVTRAVTMRSSTSRVVPGASADVRTDDRRPSFVLPSHYRSANVQLVRMEVEPKKNQRLVRLGSGAGGLKKMSSAKKGFVVQFDIDRDGDLTVVRPLADLEVGEYAILAVQQVFDFAITE